MKNWKDGLGLEFVQKVEDLLERTMRRRMDEALNVLSSCLFHYGPSDDPADDEATAIHPINCQWTHKGAIPDVEENLDQVRATLENPEESKDTYIRLADVLKVLERLGEIVIPTTNRKEDEHGNDK
jgi:hypothetical protein